MSALTVSDQAFLLSLARHHITVTLKGGPDLDRPASLSPVVFDKRGCFVTLHRNQALRGCIGTIEPRQALIDNVQENAGNAAFRDPRFSPVTLDELNTIDIEISVLTVPKVLTFQDGEDLKRQLKPGVHGVIVSRGWQRSTFLPQVWEQLPDKEQFLSQLCRKGGMGGDFWESTDTKVEVYTASYFSE